jgi:hypothetical protein
MLITPVHMCWEMFEVIVCSLCQLLTWPSYEKKAQFRSGIKTESLPHIRIGISTRNGNASETKANESFDNGDFFDIEAKGTPSIVNKLFSKRSEHISYNKNYIRSEANTFDSKTTVFKAKTQMSDSKKIIFEAKRTH